jgi:hypothetical protein
VLVGLVGARLVELKNVADSAALVPHAMMFKPASTKTVLPLIIRAYGVAR